MKSSCIWWSIVEFAWRAHLSSNLLLNAKVIREHTKYRRARADRLYSIGRITEGLLLGIATTVDIVEPITKFADNLMGKDGIGKIFNIGLEDWSPEQSPDAKYDLIWNQWCLGHLTDLQLQSYLEKCAKAINVDGLIVVKENLSTSGEDLFDELDSSVTRWVLCIW